MWQVLNKGVDLEEGSLCDDEVGDVWRSEMATFDVLNRLRRKQLLVDRVSRHDEKAFTVGYDWLGPTG